MKGEVIDLGDYPGKLIVIEGPDHVGRSLHTKLIRERLEAHGVATAHIGQARSDLLRDLIKSNNSDIHQLNWRTRSLLYATDLHDQVIHNLIPLLEAGFVVVADRYMLTQVVRETIRGGDSAWIESIYANIPKPDATVILQAGSRRLLNRILFGEELQSLNHFEAGMDLNFSSSITTSFLNYQKKISKKFSKLADEQGLPIIPTRDSVENVHKQIWKEILPEVEDMLQPLS